METSENNVISKDDFTDVHNNKTRLLTYHSANLKKIFLYYCWISFSSFSWGDKKKIILLIVFLYFWTLLLHMHFGFHITTLSKGTTTNFEFFHIFLSTFTKKSE